MKTVLIVEGDEHDQEALQALLQEHGYKVAIAHSRQLQVSEIKKEELPSGRQADVGGAFAAFRSDRNGKLYRIKQAEDTTFEVMAPPLGVEQHYQGFYENAPIAIFRSSLAGKLLSINPAGARMHKYDSAQEMIEKVNRASIAQALCLDAGHCQEVLAKVLHSTDWYVGEERFRCKDGSFFDGYFHIRAVRDAEGRAVEFEGFVEDISERKRVERKLKFTQFAIDKTVDQAFWLDDNGRIIYVNDAASYSLGYGRDELLDLSIFDIDPDCTPEFFTQRWQDLKRHCSETFERRHRASDGHIFPVEVRANYLVHEGQEYLCFFVSDISERKRTEQALKFTQFAIDNSIDQAFWMGEDARLIYVNDAACRALGYSREELLQMSIPDIGPTFQAEVFAEYWRKLKEEGSLAFESWHRAKDGRVYPVEIRSNYVEFDGKEYICAFATDISERKRTEEALKLSQVMVDRAALGIFRGREDARILFVNDYWARKLGYTPAELRAMTFFDIDPTLTREVWQEHRQKLIASGFNTFESVHRCKDGSEIPVEITVNLFRHRGQVYSCSFAKDIRERKQAESALREAQLVLENSPAVLFRWRVTEEWPVEMVSGNVTRFGYTQEELLSGEIPFAEMVHPEDLQRVVAEVKEYIRQGEERFQQEYRIVTRDKEVRWIDDRTVVERDAAGEVTHFQGILIDITEQKRTERVIAARMRLHQLTAKYTLEELLEATLNEAETLTGSQAGFYHLLEEDQQTLSLQSWSTRTKQEFCKTQDRRLHYPVSKAGVWADCIHQRRAVIHDDYAALPHRKGLPSGHLPIDRELVVPVFRGEKIVAVLGVGNKPISYTSQDVETVSLLADLAWSMVESSRAEQALRESEERFRVLAETSSVAICLFQGEHYIYVNPAMERLFGYSGEEWGRLKFWDWAHEECREEIRRRGMARLAGQPVSDQFEARYLTKSGEEGYVLVSAGMMEYQGRPTGVASFLDITERKRAEELLRASLEEKEVLLREIHHRVKNNLQVVSSLLFLQAQKFDDADLQTCFLESQSRICSMALAHEQLYQSKNLAKISVQSYLENLVGQLQQIFICPGQRIDCRLAVEDIELDIEKVIPCGLLITELMSNAYKHAFCDGRSGQVTISLERSAEQIELTVADDGVGLPAGFDYRQAKTLGLQLVTALVNQLNGTLDHDGSNGTRFRVRFAASQLSQRS